MNNNKKSTKRLDYIHLIALNLFLFSPLLHSIRIDQEFIGLYDRVVLWTILCSIVFIFAVHLFFKKLFVLHLTMAPLYLTTLADLYLIIFYDSRLSAGYLWIVVANTHDAADYVQDFLTPMLIGITAFLAFYAICLWNMRALSLTIPWPRSLAALSIAVLVVLYGGLAARHTLKHEHIDSFAKGFSDILEFDLSAPAGVFSQGISVYSSIKRWRYDQLERESFT
ncbi:MAG: phosphoethanolamine transferase CptA, partial [Alphaproteobacteria bacterium]|nr:phosphoethanolamine transferase CptA [Alphaproteobacteria bacterium]